MTSTTLLTGSHLRTYQAIFRHPLAHNLAWRDVHALFRHLCAVEEEANGNLKVTRHGQTLVLHPPQTKDVAENDELIALRHFLERSDQGPTDSAAGSPRWLLVIDHHVARIFQAEAPGTEAKEVRSDVVPDHFRHAHKSKDFTRGEEKPDPNTYFGPVIKALQTAGPILVFGTGKGSGSEMEQFVAWAKRHQPDIDRRIVGTTAVDEHHLTDDQLLAKARGIFASLALIHQ
jgi:hypothetical protein